MFLIGTPKKNTGKVSLQLNSITTQFYLSATRISNEQDERNILFPEHSSPAISNLPIRRQ